MEYRYKAMKASGEMTEGVFMADSRHGVIEMLKSNNSYPVLIEEKVKIGTQEINFTRSVSARDLSFFCRQLHAMLKAGSTITKTLDIMKRQVKNKRLKVALMEMYNDVQKGTVLSLSMKKYPRIFPELMVYMVESGELSGTLEIIFLRLSVYFEKEGKLKSKVRSAMVYPIILLIMSLLVVAFLVTFILPTFVKMFERSTVELPGLTKALLGASEFARHNGIALFLVTVALLLIGYQYIHSEKGRRNLDKLKLSLPVLKDLNTKIITARFTRNLSTMLASGVPMLTALKNLSDIISNKIVSDAILGFRDEVQKGNELHLVVRESHLFPPMVDGMIEIGKESGTLDDILDKTADYYDDEVENALQRMVAMFEPMMILILAFIVGFIVIAMALPMFDMFKTIS
jgi:type IV pilus assembly protein PilC